MSSHRPPLMHSHSVGGAGDGAGFVGGAKGDSASCQTASEVLALLEQVVSMISGGGGGGGGGDQTSTAGSIRALNAAIKLQGPSLENTCKERLAELMGRLRVSCKDVRLDLASRLRLLEVIEMRAMKWKNTEEVEEYYRQKITQIEGATSAVVGVATGASRPISGQNDSGSAAASPDKSSSVQRSISWNPNAPEYSPAKSSPESKKQRAAAGAAGDAAALPDQPNSSPGPYTMEVVVGGDRIKMEGTNRQMLTAARQILLTHLSPGATATAKVGVEVEVKARSTPSSSPSAKNLRQPDVTEPTFPSASASEKEKTKLPSPGDGDGDGDVNANANAHGQNAVIASDAENGQKDASFSSSSGPRLAYDRDLLLGLSGLAQGQGQGHGALPAVSPPADWANVVNVFPELKRKPDSHHALPFDWQESFGNSSIVLCSASNGNNNSVYNNNFGRSKSMVVAPDKKKNFLEVLRPNAPLRKWNEEMGEWVEVEPAGVDVGVGAIEASRA